MSGMVVLMLLGLGLTAAALGMGSDDEPAEETPDEDEGQVHVVSDGDILFAGDGDDTITGGVADDYDQFLRDATIHAGDGDDLIEIHAERTDIHAGPGNDTITGAFMSGVLSAGPGDDTIILSATNSNDIHGDEGDDWIEVSGHGYSAEIHGGEGNDTIIAGDVLRGHVHGGPGDDLLILDYQGYEEVSQAWGGEGNDTLRATAHFDSYFAADVLHGGEGEDVFEISFTPHDHVGQNDFGQPVTSDTILVISDFARGEDTLYLDVALQNPDSPPPVISLEEAADGSGTHVVIEYRAFYHDEDEPEEMTLQGRIWLPGATGLTLDDIIIGTPETQAAAA